MANCAQKSRSVQPHFHRSAPQQSLCVAAAAAPFDSPNGAAAIRGSQLMLAQILVAHSHLATLWIRSLRAK